MSEDKFSYNEEAVVKAIAQALEEFYSSVISNMDKLNITKVMSRKNPYLYRAKAVSSAADIVDGVLSAFVSSSEETVFGNCFFEPIAIAASGGQKSIAEGIDLEIDRGSKRIAVAVKSGTSVFNADSKKRQEENFLAANKLARQAGKALLPIVGYSYGRKSKNNRKTSKPVKDWFFEELAGQEFWERITGDPDFYKKIIPFMGKEPEKYIEQFNESYSRAENRLIAEFTTNFCKEDGSIDWDELVEFNSGKEKKKTRAQLKKEEKKRKSK